MADENTAGSGDDPKEPDASEPSEPSEPVPPPALDPVAHAATRQAAASGVATTPGQRLAAKQALKATQKRDFKEELKRNEDEKRRKELEDADRMLGRGPVDPALPQNVERVAGKFTGFLQDNRERILIALGLLVVLAGVALGLTRFMRSGSREQAAELARALELLNAPISADDPDGKTDDGKPLFKSEAERAAKSASAFADAAKEGPDNPTGLWARLGQAASQLALGKSSEARALFQSTGGNAGDEPAIRARALEGVAIALEGEGKSDEALKTYEQLKELEGQKELAQYHLARLRLAKGDREGGKGLLKALYDQLNAAKEDSPPSPYLKAEVELRLAELDSSLVDQGSSQQQPQQFSDEQLQRLIEQLQKGKAPGAKGE
jgi:hypothetical protein